MTLNTPVALLIFNRPRETAQVFERIRAAAPRRLLVVADGPRPEKPGEGRACAETRAVIDRIDWPCELLTDFAEENLGCRDRVASGLRWVFDTVPEAIVLEDDCVPDPSFFRFCEELLDRFRDDERVMHISGDNFGPGRPRAFTRLRGEGSYYFSRYVHVWGWASWRHAFAHFDVRMSGWRNPVEREAVLSQFDDPAERAFWAGAFDDVATGTLDTWDYQWVYACMRDRALSVMPRTNLVTNIGHGPGATHTTAPGHPLADLPSSEIGFPLRSPRAIKRDVEADSRTARLYFGRS